MGIGWFSTALFLCRFYRGSVGWHCPWRGGLHHPYYDSHCHSNCTVLLWDWVCSSGKELRHESALKEDERFVSHTLWKRFSPVSVCTPHRQFVVHFYLFSVHYYHFMQYMQVWKDQFICASFSSAVHACILKSRLIIAPITSWSMHPGTISSLCLSGNLYQYTSNVTTYVYGCALYWHALLSSEVASKPWALSVTFLMLNMYESKHVECT